LGEFNRIAERIAGHLEEVSREGGLRSQDIADIVGNAYQGEAINCYPGRPGSGCHDLAVFVSLSLKRNGGNKRGHLTCRKAIEKLIQHMQGACARSTRYALLVVDSWDGEAISEWEWNIKEIQQYAHLEVYLISGGAISAIIPFH